MAWSISPFVPFENHRITRTCRGMLAYEVMMMDYYPTLSQLLTHSVKSKELYHSFHPDMQIFVQKQAIHTYADLQKIAFLFAETPGRK